MGGNSWKRNCRTKLYRCEETANDYFMKIISGMGLMLRNVEQLLPNPISAYCPILVEELVNPIKDVYRQCNTSGCSLGGNMKGFNAVLLGRVYINYY